MVDVESRWPATRLTAASTAAGMGCPDLFFKDRTLAHRHTTDGMNP
jgi:hypothetical protein